MIRDGAVADAQDEGDFLVPLALGDPEQHLALSPAQARPAEIQVVCFLDLSLLVSCIQSLLCLVSEHDVPPELADDLYVIHGEALLPAFVKDDAASMGPGEQRDRHLMADTERLQGEFVILRAPELPKGNEVRKQQRLPHPGHDLSKGWIVGWQHLSNALHSLRTSGFIKRCVYLPFIAAIRETPEFEAIECLRKNMLAGSYDTLGKFPLLVAMQYLQGFDDLDEMRFSHRARLRHDLSMASENGWNILILKNLKSAHFSHLQSLHRSFDVELSA